MCERAREIICVSVCLYVSIYLHVTVSECGCLCLHACVCVYLPVCECMRECVRAVCSPGQMTLGNCSLYGDLSDHITVTKGGGQRSDLFPHLSPLSPLMIIMNDLCSTGMCMCLHVTMRRQRACECVLQTE